MDQARFLGPGWVFKTELVLTFHHIDFGYIFELLYMEYVGIPPYNIIYI